MIQWFWLSPLQPFYTKIPTVNQFRGEKRGLKTDTFSLLLCHDNGCVHRPKKCLKFTRHTSVWRLKPFLKPKPSTLGIKVNETTTEKKRIWLKIYVVKVTKFAYVFCIFCCRFHADGLLQNSSSLSLSSLWNCSNFMYPF